MLQASTRAVLIAPIIAAGVFLAGCGRRPSPAPGTGSPAAAPRAAALAPAAGPGEAVAAGSAVGQRTCGRRRTRQASRPDPCTGIPPTAGTR